MKSPNSSQNSTTTGKAKPHRSIAHVVFKILGILIPIALMGWIFLVIIPSQVSYAEVWDTLTSLSVGQNSLLLIGGLLTILTYGWTSATVLPGISLTKGTQSAVSGQLTSVVLPAPVDLAIRFSMYKSYGFSVDKSAVAVGLAGIARYFTVVAIPLLGLVFMLITGQGKDTYLTWLIVGGTVFVIALWLLRLVLSSTRSAQKVGRGAQKVITKILRVFGRETKKDIAALVVDFGARTRDVAVDNFRSIALSNITWGISCFFVLLMAVRFCGIGPDIFSASYILLITGVMLLLNAFPITPGGIGVTETILVSIIPFPNSQVQALFLSALFVYRIYTWFLPMPVGAVAYYSWRKEQSSSGINLKATKTAQA